METMTQLAALAAVTILAMGAASVMAWAFLHGALRLMQPTVRTTQRPPLEIVHGTRAVAQGFTRSGGLNV